MMVVDGNIYIRVVDDIPATVRGFTIADPEGYNVYLSAMLSDQERRKAYLHEVGHINGHDLEGGKDILKREDELHGK